MAGCPVMLNTAVKAAMATTSMGGMPVPAPSWAAASSPTGGGSMDMVGVTSRSNSSSNRATMARVIRWSSATERARVRLSTASAASLPARLWGSTSSQSSPSVSLSPALTTWRNGPSPTGSKTSASRVVTA